MTTPTLQESSHAVYMKGRKAWEKRMAFARCPYSITRNGASRTLWFEGLRDAERGLPVRYGIEVKSPKK